MATLHIVRQSAFNTNDFFQCLQVLDNKDVIVFIDDGCYNLQHSLINSIDSNKGIQLKVIEQHAKARGIMLDEKVNKNINQNINEKSFAKITMKNLVSLTFESDRVITWQ